MQEAKIITNPDRYSAALQDVDNNFGFYKLLSALDIGPIFTMEIQKEVFVHWQGNSCIL